MNTDAADVLPRPKRRRGKAPSKHAQRKRRELRTFLDALTRIERRWAASLTTEDTRRAARKLRGET